MRTSLLIASLIAAPVLLITACGPNAAPTKGTVVEKEYEAAKTKTQHTPITRQTCTTSRVKGKSRRTCTNVKTGRYKTSTATVKHECYELDIRQANGDVTEICDRAAYYALNVGDRYSSAINYSTKKVRR